MSERITEDASAMVARLCVDAFRAADEWDTHPTIAMIVVKDGIPDAPFILPFGLGNVWSEAPPYEVVRGLAYALGFTGGPPLPEGTSIVGIVTVTEGWSYSGPPKPDGWWETHSIADDPEGAEMVSAIVADVEGRALGAAYVRGEDEVHQMGQAGGRLLAAAREVLDVLTKETA